VESLLLEERFDLVTLNLRICRLVVVPTVNGINRLVENLSTKKVFLSLFVNKIFLTSKREFFIVVNSQKINNYCNLQRLLL
jgi:hypothetical protein